MQRDALYLSDVMDAADAIERFIIGRSRESFIGDELVQRSIVWIAATHNAPLLKQKIMRILMEEFADHDSSTD
jgi:uncharacterized protein with HEPN domain